MNILNDFAFGGDCLDRSIYAQALSHLVSEVDPPLTIGIFARWGGGKTHLMNRIKGKVLAQETSKMFVGEICTQQFSI